MAKTKISEWSSTPANNTDIDSINIAEGCAPSGINDAIRELMSQVKDLYSGTTGDVISVAGGGTGIGTLTGLVKGNGTSAFSAATAGTDYVTPTGTETLTNKTLTAPIIDNPKLGYTTTATAAGTTTLTVTSNHQQLFTGTTTQTIVLPVTSTLALGMSYSIENNSTGVLTVQSSGLNAITTIPAGVTTLFTCILTSGTTAASWDYDQVGFATITGTGDNVLATSPTLVTPALGTPSSATLTNATGLPISTGVSGLGTGIATFLATPTSANLISAVSDETGSGSLVFATSPTLVTPILGTPTSGNFSTGTFTWPTFNQNTSGTAGGLSGTPNISVGTIGSGAITSTGNSTFAGTLLGISASVGRVTIGGAGQNNAPLYLQSDSTSGTRLRIINTGTGGKTYEIDANGVSNSGEFAVRNITASTVPLLINGTTNAVSLIGLVDISASTAGQIQFPATQNASAGSNVLDDYEEGTWTPSIGGTATYSIQAGNYIKVGNLVTITFRIGVTLIGTGSATTISGLPFNVTSAIGGGSLAGSVGYWVSAATSISSCQLSLASTSTLNLNFTTGNQASSTYGGTFFGNGTVMWATATYVTT